jgi:hypothetical protein
MVTTEEIIGQMNGLSEEIRLRKDDISEEVRDSVQARELQRQEQERTSIVRTEEVQPAEEPEQGVPLSSAENAEEKESEDQCPELVAQEEDDIRTKKWKSTRKKK